MGLVGGLLAGEGQGEGVVEDLIGLAGILGMLALPTAAVMLATRSVVAREPRSRTVLVAAVIALVVTLTAMPLLLTSRPGVAGRHGAGRGGPGGLRTDDAPPPGGDPAGPPQSPSSS